jgi:hypothetical protein
MGVKIDVLPGSAAEHLLKLTEDSPRGHELTAEHALAQSFRGLLLDMEVNEEKWAVLMDRFLRQELQSEEHPTRADMTVLRGNLANELTRPVMTWKTYCKGLRFLGLKGVHFAVYASTDEGDLVSSSMAFRPN